MTINWVQTTEFYINPQNSYYPLCVFFNSYNDPNVYPNVPVGMGLNAWKRVDLKPYDVPADAKFAMIAGIGIITGGANLTMAVRAPGDASIPDGSYYDQQSLSAQANGGERSAFFTIAPLINGEFDIWLSATKYPNDGSPFVPGQTPAVGVNLKIEGWGR